jgi:3-oxoacyl-(acyl-carrier-protein) synthase III
MRIKVNGTGRAIPLLCVTSSALDLQFGKDEGSIELETGVAERYVCEEESQIDLAVSASNAALKNAGITPSDIDLVLSGSGIPYQPLPAMAPLVMRELGIQDGKAAAFDVNSTCLSFVSAFETAALHIDSGQHHSALVFSSEVASRALPWGDQVEISALFGDGAAAVVLSRASVQDSGCIRATLMRSFPSAYEACSIGAGGTRFDFHKEPEEFARHAIFQMDGVSLFRLSSRHFRKFVFELIEKAGWNLSEVDLIVPHQASPAALAHMARQIGVGPDRLVDITRSFGNQVAASIPFAFDIARKENKIKPGAKVLFLGTSAGVSFGGLALEI